MRKIAAVVILYCIATSSFAQENLRSVWTNQPVNVDGTSNDWNLPLKFYDNETNLFFAIKNDSNNLYLCFQSKDDIIQTKIMRAGMKIILSDKINGKHKSVFSFPLSAKHFPKPVDNPDEIKPDPLAPRQSERDAFIARDTMMEAKGFAKTNGIISTNNISGIRASIGFDSANILTCEVAIPLKELFGDHYDPKDITKDISLNVIINPVATNSGNSAGSGGYSGRGGARGGGYGGQRGGNRSEDEERSQYQQRSVMSQKTELKQKFVLATPVE